MHAAPGETTAHSRSTRQKRALEAVLQDDRAFRSAREIHAALAGRGESVAISTVYNQLRTLAEDHRLDTLRSDDGETLYRRCALTAHHHHLVCRSCGAAAEIEGADIERWTAKVASERGFVDIDHSFEIVGTCGECATRSGRT